MKLFLILFVAFAATAFGQEKIPHLRFWRGFVGPKADEIRLKERLNQELLPETIRVGAGKGLVAYLPTLFPKERPSYLPVEVALVAYSSKEEYDAIRATPEGKAYGDLHFVEGMFEKKTEAGYVSKSDVASAFSGEVVLPPSESEAQTEGVAYGIHADRIDWQAGFAFLHILKRTGSTDDASISKDAKEYLLQLTNLQVRNELQASIVLVNRKYLLALINFSDESQARAYTRSSFFIPRGYADYDGFAQTSGKVLEPRRLLNYPFER